MSAGNVGLCAWCFHQASVHDGRGGRCMHVGCWCVWPGTTGQVTTAPAVDPTEKIDDLERALKRIRREIIDRRDPDVYAAGYIRGWEALADNVRAILDNLDDSDDDTAGVTA